VAVKASQEEETKVSRLIETVDEIVQNRNVTRGAAIPILQRIQRELGYVPPAMLQRVAELTGMPASDLYGITTFYTQFRTQPLGLHTIRVCHGTACHLAGAESISDALRMATGAGEGETSPDGLFTVERVACLGCCSLAPVVMIDDETYGHLTPEKVRKLVDRYREKSRAASD